MVENYVPSDKCSRVLSSSEMPSSGRFDYLMASRRLLQFQALHKRAMQPMIRKEVVNVCCLSSPWTPSFPESTPSPLRLPDSLARSTCAEINATRLDNDPSGIGESISRFLSSWKKNPGIWRPACGVQIPALKLLSTVSLYSSHAASSL